MYFDVWQVLGSEAPCMAHRSSLPYVDATLAEVQRLSNIGTLYYPYLCFSFISLICISFWGVIESISNKPCWCSVPLAGHHIAAYDTTLNGYRIPKGTWISPMLYAISLSQDTWIDPGVFRPERFLDDSEKCHRPENLLPFGLGKACTVLYFKK